MSLHCNKVLTIDFAPDSGISINTWYMVPRRAEALRWPPPRVVYPWLPPGTGRVPYPESERGLFGIFGEDIPDCHQELALFLIPESEKGIFGIFGVDISLTATRNRPFSLFWARERNIWNIWWGNPLQLQETDQVPCPEKGIFGGYPWLPSVTDYIPYTESEKGMFGIIGKGIPDCHEEPAMFLILSQRKEYLVKISLTATKNRPCSLS